MFQQKTSSQFWAEKNGAVFLLGGGGVAVLRGWIFFLRGGMALGESMVDMVVVGSFA